MNPPKILTSPMRRRSWGWSWRAGCVIVEVHDPVASPAEPHLEQHLVKVYVYGEVIVLAYESSPQRAAALVGRKLRQILACLQKVAGLWPL